MFKICLRCGQEYQRWISVCADCGGPLDLATETLERAPEVRSLPPASDLALLKVQGPWYLQELAELLQSHGISSRIDSDPPGAPIEGPAVASRDGFSGHATYLGIYVQPADLEAAKGIASSFEAARLPDLLETEPEHDPSACPACGEPLAHALAPSCSSCGLEFPDLES